MAFTDRLLTAGEPIWAAQKTHPFVRELAAGTLDDDAFRHWVTQDYQYLLDYARVFALAATKTEAEATMTRLMDIAHTILAYEMDLHREFAADYGLSRDDLDAVTKSPTCVAYTNYLVRTAYAGSIAEISAAIYPCGKGYLDIASHMADLATTDHRYTPFIEKYTSEEFHDAVAWMSDLVNDCAASYPGLHDAMHESFLTSARLEHAFWEMAYTQETWAV